MQSQLMVLGVVALLSLSLTGAIRWYALANSVIDSPNERSSHHRDTPTGGGLGMVLAFLAGLLACWHLGYISEHDVLVLVPAGGALALIGFWDDHSPVSPFARLVTQFLCSAWVLGGYGLPMQWLDASLPSVIPFVACLIALVWLLNLYNFMDGIDGIASIEAITALLGWAILSVFFGSSDWLVPVLLMAAVAGFLVWNFPPAKIFMGDAGSVFLGLVIGALAIRSGAVKPGNLYVWAILLGVFVVDASVTIVTRVLRGENPLKPHRSHAYQLAAQQLSSHRAVTLATACINLVWLLPVAALVASGNLDARWGLLMAYCPLVLVAIGLGAGRS
jgi:Fuc2NAc and GlcNAc transferase